MNETTPPPGAPDAPNPTPNPNGSDRFFTWLRGLGIVRGNERWFAGVAGGIATKARIDPLIVRGIFVVLALLGGPGILLYLAGWLLLPDASGRIHLEELFRGRATGGVIATTVILGALVVLPALISLVTGVFSGGFFLGWNVFGLFPHWAQVTMNVIWWALLLPAGIIFLTVWFSRGHGGSRSAAGSAPSAPGHTETTSNSPGAYPAAPEGPGGATFVGGFGASGPSGTAAAGGPSAQSGPGTPSGFADRTQAFADSAAQRTNDWAQRSAEWGARVGRDANAWGERFGRDAGAWGERVGQEARQHFEARRLGAAHVVLTLAVALLAAGAATLWALTTDALDTSPIPGDDSGAILLAIIAATIVLAASLIVVGIRGRHSGWIGFLTFCGVVALLFTSVFPWGGRVQPFGDVTTTVAGSEGPSGLTVLAGRATVDLTELDEARDFTVWVLAGNATVELPEDQPALVQVFVLAGQIEQDREDADQHQSGPFLHRTVGANLEGADPDEISHIAVRVIAGNVDVAGATSPEELSDRFARKLRASASLHSGSPGVTSPKPERLEFAS